MEAGELFVIMAMPLVRSRQEFGKILEQTKLDIVLSPNAHQPLSEMMTILLNFTCNYVHMLPIEDNCWRLPVFRDGENCLGASFSRK